MICAIQCVWILAQDMNMVALARNWMHKICCELVLMEKKTYMTWRNVLSAEKIQQDSTKAEDYTFRSDPSYKVQ